MEDWRASPRVNRIPWRFSPGGQRKRGCAVQVLSGVDAGTCGFRLEATSTRRTVQDGRDHLPYRNPVVWAASTLRSTSTICQGCSSSQNDPCMFHFEMRCFHLLVVSGHLQQALCYYVPVCGPRAFLPFLQMVAAMVAVPELCPDEGRVRGLARLDSPPEAHMIALFVTLDTDLSSNN